MNDDQIHTISRLAIAVAGLAYVVVFLVGLSEGTDVEVVLLKATASMLCLGVLGWLALGLVGSPGGSGEGRARPLGVSRLNVVLSATPEELGQNTVEDAGEGRGEKR